MRYAGILFLILASCTITSVLTAVAAEKRVALVIGNSRYEHVSALTNTANDARLIARTLQGLGFHLVGGSAQLDLNDSTFKKVIAAFGKEAEDSEVALFYYAGHGLQMRSANFLVPVDADPIKPSDVDLQLVDAQVVLDEMQDSGASLKLLILDACRNNPFGGRGLRDISHGLAVMPALRGTLISYSTQPGNVASDGPAGGDSPFTLALADAFHRPGVDAIEMFNDVGLAVDKSTNGEQQPWLASSPIQGKFYFAGNPPPLPITPAPVQSIDSDSLYWQSVLNSTNAADYKAYLDRFPNGIYATLAQTKLAALVPPPSRTPALTNQAPPNPQREALESRVMVPSHLQLATPTGAPSDMFLGEWYGLSSLGVQPFSGQPDGREIIFAIQSISGTKVIAMLGYAPFHELQAQAFMRAGVLNGNEIDFPTTGGLPDVVVTGTSSNTIRVTTTTQRGTSTALMRRIDR